MTIQQKSNRLKALVWLSLFAIGLMALSVVVMSGCSDKLEGDLNENQAPVVYFVNIPPDNSSFSYNPEVFWFGTDVDGQITYYRYYVATADEIGTADVDQARLWAASLDDTSWIYVDVNPLESNPQTAHVISLSADMDDPINTFVEQFVFLQAYDDDDKGSQIAVKCLNRNDHPPATRIYNTIKDDTPFVNALTAGGIVTGVKLLWEGSDVRDYDEQGLIAPPFEFEWCLFGPYDAVDSAHIFDNFIRLVWFGDDGTMYECGESMTINDSSLVDTNIGGVDTSIWVHETTIVNFTCDTDTTGTNTLLGYRRDTLITTTDEDYFGQKLVTMSDNGYDSWVMDMRDTVYNAYRHCVASDTTISNQFMFTVRSRDDAGVADPTPAFAIFPVIDPRHENDVLLIDFTNPNPPAYGQVNTLDSSIAMRKRIFRDLITRWSDEVDFDTTGFTNDYLIGYDYTVESPLSLSKLLSYKMIIIYSDHTKTSTFISAGSVAHPRVLTAIDAGVNCWATGRCMIFGSHAESSTEPPVPADFYHYFGVEQVFFTSWAAFLRGAADFNGRQEIRTEDFVGAYSMDESRWPNLDVDTALLHGRYTYWEDASPLVADCPWIDTCAALPEVGWCERRYGTEVMYLYKSKYGSNHPLGYPYTIEGTPVAHRFETNLYRTAWFMFAPLAIDSMQMQQVADSVLEWLYDPTLGSTTVTAKRYPDAATKISIDEAQLLFIDRTR